MASNSNGQGQDVAVTGARLSPMANLSFWITTSPQSAARLHGQNTCEGHVGYLASFASYHYVRWLFKR
jgi:hypothetical protein